MNIKKYILTMILATSSVLATADSKIEFTVMHGPGGVSDITTRELNKDLNYNVVNRPGAGGRIAIRHLMQQEAISLATMAQIYVTNPLNVKDLNYNPATDLELIATVGVMPSALVCNKQTGISTFKEFINTKKSLSFAIGGFGSSEHLSTETLLSKLSTKHKIVAYAQGGNTGLVDLLGGHIDCMFANYPTIKSHLADLNFIMISHDIGTNATLWESEFNQSFPLQSYLGIIVSKKLDTSVKSKIKSDIKAAFENTSLNNRLSAIGLFPKLGMDADSLKNALDNNENLKKFILDNKIKTSGS